MYVPVLYQLFDWVVKPLKNVFPRSGWRTLHSDRCPWGGGGGVRAGGKKKEKQNEKWKKLLSHRKAVDNTNKRVYQADRGTRILPSEKLFIF